MTSNNSGILSQPVRLRWLGWESNTFALQEAGWEVSARQNLEYQKMQLAFRHKEMQMHGLSDYLDFDYFQKRNILYPVSDINQMPTFGCNIANNIVIQIQSTPPMSESFNPIDARPIYSEFESCNLDTIAHFRKIETGENEIFLKRASMDDILNMALSKQEPRQEQIRKEMVRRNEFDVMRKSQLKANLRLVG